MDLGNFINFNFQELKKDILKKFYKGNYKKIIKINIQ